MKNYYEQLEVSQKASQEVIEKAYKVLAKKYHPDANPDNIKEAEEKFKEISEAYEILLNPDKRKKYDLELEKENPTVSYDKYMELLRKNQELTASLNNINSRNMSNAQGSSYSSTNRNTSYSSTTRNPSYTSTTTNTNHTTNNQTNHKYYYSDGRPASAFTYYKYKIKKTFEKIFLVILFIIFILLFLFNVLFKFNTLFL